MRKMKTKIRGTSGCVDDVTNGTSLPEDIINDILPMLPAKSIVRFRCVCKSWYNLFQTTRFAKLQLDYSLKNREDGILIDTAQKICYLDYDLLSSDSLTLYNKLVHIAYPVEYEKKEILGSCNGLVCYRSSKDDILIWNPFTRDYKKIPTPPQPGSGTIYVSYGFGYDFKAEDYKLIVYKYLGGYSRIHIYALKLNSWKTIRNIPFEVPCRNLVFLNGHFHWVDGSFPWFREMSWLDTSNDTVKHIPLPRQYSQHCLCLLGGCLCLIAKDFEQTIWEVWTMKDYGVAESWTKMFTIDHKWKHTSILKKCERNYFRLQQLEPSKQSFKNAAILVHHVNTNSTYLFDLNRGVSRKLEIDGILPGFGTWAFCGSLVSPN